jgi:hypothetical protein
MAKNQARPVTQEHSVPASDNDFNYLVSAELADEGNYNMIGDGIINNVPKPSLLERLEELEKRKRERYVDELADDRRERHKADYLDSKNER